MEYIRKFDNNYDYENFLQDEENIDKMANYDTKMFYLEEDEKMIIGSGRRDIILDLKQLNAENANAGKVGVTSTSDENLTVNIYYKKLNKGQFNINLCQVIGINGYVIDLENSSVKMILEDDIIYTELQRDVDWEYNNANGVVTLLRPIEGNININFKSVSYDDLLDNTIKVFINGQLLYNDGNINSDLINLVSGEEYTITAQILSGASLQMAVISGNKYGYIQDNKIIPQGSDNEGGYFAVAFSCYIFNGYKPLTVNVQFNVSLENARILNWEETVPSNIVYAGDQLDLRGLRVSYGCSFFLETSERIQTTEIDRVYNIFSNGEPGIGTIKVHILGNNVANSVVITKTLEVRLKENNIEWGTIVYNNTEYNEFGIVEYNNEKNWFTDLIEVEAGKDIYLNSIADYNSSFINYTIQPEGIGQLTGNIYTSSLPDGNNRTITVTATVPANGNYSKSSIIAKFIVKPIIVTNLIFANNTTEFYPTSTSNEIEQVNISVASSVPYIPNLNPTIEFYTGGNPNGAFEINNGILFIKDGYDLNGENREIKVLYRVLPGTNYKSFEYIRTLTCKLKPISASIVENAIIYVNQNMSFTLMIYDMLAYTNNDITEKYWNKYGAHIYENGRITLRHSTNNYESDDDMNSNFSTLTSFTSSQGNYSFTKLTNTIGMKFNIRITDASVKYLYVKLSLPNVMNYTSYSKIFKFIVRT